MQASQLNVAVIGAAGRGEHAWRTILNAGEKIVAICDVDERALQTAVAEIGVHHPNVKVFKDFRVMFDTMQNLDLSIIATPDHGHALQASHAMERGCHVFIEPPLARTLSESDFLIRKAHATRVKLLMGNQVEAQPAFCQAADLLRAGIIGDITEVLVWTNRPLWPQGGATPPGNDSPPDHLDWDLWLCGAPARLYKERVYHRYNWRGWCDFGTGALGDVGCQLLSLPLRALDLTTPCTIINLDNDGTARHESFPRASRLRFTFKKADKRGGTLYLEWLDGGLLPDKARLPAAVASLGALPGSGCLLQGSRGVWLMAHESGNRHYLALTGEAIVSDFQKHPATAGSSNAEVSRAPLREFIHSLKEDTPVAPDPRMRQLMECVLIGCIAQRLPEQLTWDSHKQKFINNPAAQELALTRYRPGWSL